MRLNVYLARAGADRLKHL